MPGDPESAERETAGSFPAFPEAEMEIKKYPECRARQWSGRDLSGSKKNQTRHPGGEPTDCFHFTVLTGQKQRETG